MNKKDEWVVSSTSDELVVFNGIDAIDVSYKESENVDNYDGKDIKKVVLKRTTSGKLKSIAIEFNEGI